METLTTPFWNTVNSRSVFHWELNDNIFSDLAKVNFAHVPDDLAAYLNRLPTHRASTKIVEDAINRCRHQEGRLNAKQHTSAMSLWQAPVAEKLLTSLYKYTEVSADDCLALLGKPESLPEIVFVLARRGLHNGS